MFLFKIYTRVKKLGGYDAISDDKTWKLMLGEKELGSGFMNKSKYEKILLPFERHEAEINQKPNYESLPSDLTISAVSKSNKSSTGDMCPSLEIIPIKKENQEKPSELTPEQKMEIQKLVKSRDIKVTEAPINNSPDVSVPVTVIFNQENVSHSSFR